ncbi:hypothetical protein AAC387_Pa03g0508 [Persea americana]
MDSPPSPSPIEASSSTNGSSEHKGDRSPSVKEMVFGALKSGQWVDVLKKYEENAENIQTASITSSKEKVLHIAISHNRSDVAKKLLGFVANGKVIEEMKNDRDNNPLHLAASLGKADMCEAMMGRGPELIECRNMDGETPLFLAALHGRKEAFYTLRQKWIDIQKEDVSIQHYKRNDGNSILHVTILGEYFDLAFQKIKWYPKLATFRNERGHSPLHILALHPSVFRSGCYLNPLDRFIYRCLLVEELDDETEQSLKLITGEQNKKETAHNIPGNYVTCFNALKILGKGLRAATWRFRWCKGKEDIETPQSSKTRGQVDKTEAEEKNRHFPPNYYTCFSLLVFLLDLLLVVCGLGFYRVIKLKEKKRRHVHATQLMKKLVKAADSWEAEDNGSRPSEDSLNNLKDRRIDMYEEFPRASVDGTSNAEAPTGLEEVAKDNEDEINGPKSATMKSSTDPSHRGSAGDQKKEKRKKHVNQMDKKKSAKWDVQASKEKSPFLVAAKMGVIEMVKEILDEFPVALDDMNQEKKNAVLLAVENRQPSVYLYLQKTYRENESVFQKVDCRGNGALHLAATFGPSRPWRIPGAVLQMQWEVKWYQFVKNSMPHQFFTHFNDRRRTPKEVLTKTHKKLVKVASKWLIKTSESCSVVAALIATVAFASATTLPGGVNEEQGTPVFEGKVALDIFIISSLVVLCFSITSLTMFLSILTSRFQVWDFYYNLPSKLMLGLGSLLASIASILVAFCSGHFLSIRNNLRHAIFPIYAATCLFLTIFVVAQFPLYLDLIRSTMAPVPKLSFEMTSI